MAAMQDVVLNAANLFLTYVPWKLRRHLINNSDMLQRMLFSGGSNGLGKTAQELRVGGRWTKSAGEPLSSDVAPLVRALGAGFQQMKTQQLTVDEAYRPAPTWAEILAAEWSPLLAQLDGGNDAALGPFLHEFFRNGGISGLWGHRAMYEQFCKEQGWVKTKRETRFISQFETWRGEMPLASLDELNQPRVGDPWGFDVDGRLVIEPAFEYHEMACRVRDLLAGVRNPVVLEIGGGFGGLAWHICKQIPGVRYIALDLPENVIVQSWFLSRALPDRQVCFNNVDTADAGTPGEVDISVLPNWSIQDLQLPRCDLAINIRSFGEMNRSTLERYFSELSRLKPTWIYHENLKTPRKDALYGIASTDYPPLRGYRSIYTCESRWPRYNKASTYPCQENLLMAVHEES